MKTKVKKLISAEQLPSETFSHWYHIDLGAITIRLHWRLGVVGNAEIVITARPKSCQIGSFLFVWIPRLIHPTWYNIETMESDEQTAVRGKGLALRPVMKVTQSPHYYFNPIKYWAIRFDFQMKYSPDIPGRLPERKLRKSEVNNILSLIISANKKSSEETGKMLNQFLSRIM